VSETEKLLTDAYYWLSMYKAGAIPEDLALEQVKGVLLKQPTLNENQQIVLEWFKKEYKEKNFFPIECAWFLLQSFDNGYLESEEERAFENLNKLQEAQVLQVFASWVEQEEGNE